MTTRADIIHWRKMRRRELMAQHPFCHYCNIRLITFLGHGTAPRFTLAIGVTTVAYATLDHKQALACGGQDTSANTVLACADCNTRKKDMPYEAFVAMREKVTR
jgi:5-methylcytosine-specific restriction endonuclease McrA